MNNPYKRVVRGMAIMCAFVALFGAATTSTSIAEENGSPIARLRGDVNGDHFDDDVFVFHADSATTVVHVTLGGRNANTALLTEWLRYWRGHADAYMLMDVDRNGREDLVMMNHSSQSMEWRACRSDGRAFYDCNLIRDNDIVRRIFATLITARIDNRTD